MGSWRLRVWPQATPRTCLAPCIYRAYFGSLSGSRKEDRRQHWLCLRTRVAGEDWLLHSAARPPAAACVTGMARGGSSQSQPRELKPTQGGSVAL